MVAGVLSVSLNLSYPPTDRKNMFEIEFHVQSHLHDSDNINSIARARVTHILVRFDTLLLAQAAPAYMDTVTSMEMAMNVLPELRTVTLETIEEEESAELADRLDVLANSGKLRRRTCEEGQKITEEAQCNLDHVGEWVVVSPLWQVEGDLGMESDESHRVKERRRNWYVSVLLQSCKRHESPQLYSGCAVLKT